MVASYTPLDVAHTFYKPGVNELNVLVAILPELWDKSIACAELLASNSNGYPVSLKRMRIEFGAESYPYTEEQEHILQTYALFNTYNSEWTLPRAKPKRIGVPHIITYSDGKEELLHANRNINQNHNVFTGMKCYIGIDKIFINQFKEITAGSWCPQANWSHPDKIGRYTVGTNIPIVSEDEAKENADVFFVPNFGFKDMFIKKEREWLEAGGNMIFAMPEVEVV